MGHPLHLYMSPSSEAASRRDQSSWCCALRGTALAPLEGTTLDQRTASCRGFSARERGWVQGRTCTMIYWLCGATSLRSSCLHLPTLHCSFPHVSWPWDLVARAPTIPVTHCVPSPGHELTWRSSAQWRRAFVHASDHQNHTKAQKDQVGWAWFHRMVWGPSQPLKA